jgi:hypothetical protein
MKARNVRCFSLGNLVEFANVVSIKFVFLLSVSELDEGFAHFCFFSRTYLINYALQLMENMT